MDEQAYGVVPRVLLNEGYQRIEAFAVRVVVGGLV
jgi:hypothetical protein